MITGRTFTEEQMSLICMARVMREVISNHEPARVEAIRRLEGLTANLKADGFTYAVRYVSGLLGELTRAQENWEAGQ
jgi:hypothetical protein